MSIKALTLLLALAVALQFGWLWRPQSALQSRATPPPAEGSFVRLSRGRTFYRVYHGPKHSPGSPCRPPLVVFVHGFSLPARISYRVMLPSLFAHDEVPEDVCVLMFDLYGRGYSDAPPDQHDASLFVGQLAELLFALSDENLLPAARQPIVLFGTSMGGGICAAFAAAYPEWIAKLALFAPVGFPIAPPKPLTAKIGVFPYVGDVLMHFLGERELVNHVLAAYPDPEAHRADLEQSLAEIQGQVHEHPGYLPGLLSTLRHFPMTGLGEQYRAIGNGRFPVLVVWGEEDVVVPFANIRFVREYVPRAKVVPVPGVGHALAEETVPTFLDFFFKDE